MTNKQMHQKSVKDFFELAKYASQICKGNDQLKKINNELVKACKLFLSDVSNSDDDVRFSAKAVDLINKNVDRFQKAIAKAEKGE